MRRKLFVLALVAGALASASPALADQPVITVEEINRTRISGPLSQRCGFPVQVQTVGTLRTTTFFDESGAIVRQIITAPNISTTYTNLNTGDSIKTRHPFPEHFEFEPDGTGTGVFTGLRLLAVEPGEGVISITAGRREFETNLTHRVLEVIEDVGVTFTRESICQTLSD